jgi:hypothetical protein
MRQRKAETEPLPFYGRLNTVPDFSNAARSFALIRKAIAEMRKTEDFLLSGVTDEEYRQGMQEVADFLSIVMAEADRATATLVDIRNRVAGYERELVDALG